MEVRADAGARSGDSGNAADGTAGTAARAESSFRPGEARGAPRRTERGEAGPRQRRAEAPAGRSENVAAVRTLAAIGFRSPAKGVGGDAADRRRAELAAGRDLAR